MIVSVGPAIIWWVIRQRKQVFRDVRIFFFTIIMIVVGVVAIYSYLPIRAATHPLPTGVIRSIESESLHTFWCRSEMLRAGNKLDQWTYLAAKDFLGKLSPLLGACSFSVHTPSFPLVIWGGWKYGRTNERFLSLPRLLWSQT